MAYDISKDIVVKDLGPIEGTNLTAQIRSYDGGEEKLAVSRLAGAKTYQVFRVSMADAIILGEFIVAACAENGIGEPEEDNNSNNSSDNDDINF